MKEIATLRVSVDGRAFDGHMDETAERELLERAKQDPQAFAVIYDRYVSRIYGFILRRTGDRQLTEDITAATFEAALKNVRRFRWRGAGVAAWLYRIGRNKLIAYYRRQRFTVSLAALIDRGFQPASADDFTELVETKDWLYTAYARLSDRDREVIALRFFEGFSSDEVAHILGLSKDRLYLNLHRALERLARKLEPDEQLREHPDG